MSSIAQSKTNISVNAHAKTNTTSNTDFWTKAEAMRFGIIPLLFILVPCLAGIGCAFSLSADNLTLFLIAGAPAMAVEALILGMASMRAIITASTISAIISIAVMIIA